MTDTLGLGAGVYGSNTYVSDPHGLQGQAATSAPGASGPGAGMSVHHAVMLIVGTAAVALVTIGVVFRRPIGS